MSHKLCDIIYSVSNAVEDVRGRRFKKKKFRLPRTMTSTPDQAAWFDAKNLKIFFPLDEYLHLSLHFRPNRNFSHKIF